MENADPNDMRKEAEYALSGKMMLICIVIIFILIIIMLCIHLYVRWYFLRHHHRQQLRRSRNRQNRRSHFVFYVDPALTATSRGLEASVIASLPVFTFSPNIDPVECAVCLSEFEEGETGRVLPKCNHSFHIECIDMWFESHTTCPLCRVHVEASPDGDPRAEVVGPVCEPEPGLSSEEVNRTGAGGCSESVYDSASSFKRIISRERKASLDGERRGEETR